MRVPWNRGGLRWYLIVIGLLVGQSTALSVIYGLPFLLAAIALRLWAKGCLSQNREVTTSGPYRFVRHPFYVGNILIDLAVVVMSGWTLLICAFLPWWIAVYLPTMRREETAMANRFGKAYRDYMARVPRIIPTARPLPPKPGFSWQNPNICRTELPRSFRFLSYPFLFLLASEIATGQFISSPYVTSSLFASLLMILLLNGLAWQVSSATRGAGIWQWEWFSRTSVRIVILTAFVAVGSSSTYFELELNTLTIPLGLLLLCLSLWIRDRVRQVPAFAEAILMIGASVLWELPWLCVVPLLLYSGHLLATRLSHLLTETALWNSRASALIPYGRMGFVLVLAICAVSAAVKEVVTDLL